MATASAMVTARMPQGKKNAGNAALSALGLSASQAINQLYDYVIDRGEMPALLEPAKKEIDAARLAQAQAWADSLSLPAGNRFASMSDDDIRRERLAARGLL